MTAITVITGADKGLGYAAARRPIEQGHTVHAGARDAHRGEQAATALGARPLLIDITDDASVTAAAEQVMAEAGRVDVLVDGTGIAGAAAVTEELTAVDLRQVFDTSVFGAARPTRAVLPLPQAAERPAVVNGVPTATLAVATGMPG